MPLSLGEEKFDVCPRRPILDDPSFYGTIFRLYARWQKGFLFDEGALGSQPAALMQCFDTIERSLEIVDDVKREQADKRKARGKKG